MNFVAVLVCALVPMLVGFIYYNPKVMGNHWMKAANISQADIEGSNMAKIFGFSILFAIMLSMSFPLLVIHQLHIGSALANLMGSEVAQTSADAKAYLEAFNGKYGNEFRTFKHGAFHGFLSALFIALPIIGMNSLFERRSFKYIFIHVLYWAICFALMGGIISAWK